MSKAKIFNLVNESIRDNCIREIDGLDLEKGYLVKIQVAKETRSHAQLRLKWVWIGFLAKELAGHGDGLSAEGWNAYFKELFIKPILCAQDEKYIAEFQRLRKKAIALKNGLSYEDYQKEKIPLWNEVQTEWLTVKNMWEYMRLIEEHCAIELMIALPVDDEYKWLYEKGIK